jgi:DNA polymerase III epsilon subunit-like protein
MAMNPQADPLERIVFCDVETTGLHPSSEVVEATVLDVAGRPIFDSLIRPSDPYGYVAEEIHGISASQLAAAHPFADLSQDLYTALHGAVLVCHNADFDAGMITAAFASCELQPPVPSATVCTMAQAAALLRAGGRISLSAAMERLNVERPPGRAHRSMFDAECTRRLWNRLHPSHGPVDSCALSLCSHSPSETCAAS